ncbi:MAG TPA: protein-export chaperone SecB [Pyrinomonadaceae bacterium]|jgi:preprotein translocase subunit SecB|nr:protein-export chaperone SecB [Pyrinomonadaceae bacterium]
MRPSQLQLDHYYFDELSFALSDDYTFHPDVEEPKLLPEDLDVRVESGRHADDPLQWMFKVIIRLDNKKNKFPYVFSIKVIGFFEVRKDYPAELVERLASVNGPSILYAAARELLAVVTGRTRLFNIFLPTVSFYEPSEATKAHSIAPARKGAKELLAQTGSQKRGAVKKKSGKKR